MLFSKNITKKRCENINKKIVSSKTKDTEIISNSLILNLDFFEKIKLEEDSNISFPKIDVFLNGFLVEESLKFRILSSVSSKKISSGKNVFIFKGELIEKYRNKKYSFLIKYPKNLNKLIIRNEELTKYLIEDLNVRELHVVEQANVSIKNLIFREANKENMFIYLNKKSELYIENIKDEKINFKNNILRTIISDGSSLYLDKFNLKGLYTHQTKKSFIELRGDNILDFLSCRLEDESNFIAYNLKVEKRLESERTSDSKIILYRDHNLNYFDEKIIKSKKELNENINSIELHQKEKVNSKNSKNGILKKLQRKIFSTKKYKEGHDNGLI